MRPHSGPEKKNVQISVGQRRGGSVERGRYAGVAASHAHQRPRGQGPIVQPARTGRQRSRSDHHQRRVAQGQAGAVQVRPQTFSDGLGAPAFDAAQGGREVGGGDRARRSGWPAVTNKVEQASRLPRFESLVAPPAARRYGSSRREEAHSNVELETQYAELSWSLVTSAATDQ